MAFIAGAVIGCLIGAMLVYAYESRWMREQEKHMDEWEAIINTTIGLQSKKIAELKNRLERYEHTEETKEGDTLETGSC